MQYVLTQEEFDALKAESANKAKALEATLQDLCTKVADHMPIVTWKADGKPTPWGCILSEIGERYCGYCDDCPVKDVCPLEYKRWSQ